jgi:ribonuclease HI
VRKHWQGRADRIARAKKAWEEAMKIASTFKKIDAEILKRIAEDPDLEYL